MAIGTKKVGSLKNKSWEQKAYLAVEPLKVSEEGEQTNSNVVQNEVSETTELNDANNEIMQTPPIKPDENESEEKAEVQPALKDETLSTKEKPAKRSKKKEGESVVSFNGGIAEFHSQFSSSHRGHPEFKQINTQIPLNVNKMVKSKMIEDDLTNVELSNLLYIMYIENGVPANLLKRYRKATEE